MRLASEPTLAGTYQGHDAEGHSAKRVFVLRLESDGRAVLSIVYIGKDQANEHGRWKQQGEDVILSFDPFGESQPPRPITFHYRRGALHPLRWDISEWGRSGPPVFTAVHGKASPAPLAVPSGSRRASRLVFLA